MIRDKYDGKFRVTDKDLRWGIKPCCQEEETSRVRMVDNELVGVAVGKATFHEAPEELLAMGYPKKLYIKEQGWITAACPACKKKERRRVTVFKVGDIVCVECRKCGFSYCRGTGS